MNLEFFDFQLSIEPAKQRREGGSRRGERGERERKYHVCEVEDESVQSIEIVVNVYEDLYGPTQRHQK
jgi:hypothetical protein